MKVLRPGHQYELDSFDGGPPQTIQFIEKSDTARDGTLLTLFDGTTNEEVLAVLIDRMAWLDERFPCRENLEARVYLRRALAALENRTARRLAQGVEGKHLAHESPAPAEPILQFFEWSHLPPHLAAESEPFCALAVRVLETLPRNPERTVALRKLLEAKDAAVRAKLYVDPAAPAPAQEEGFVKRVFGDVLLRPGQEVTISGIYETPDGDGVREATMVKGEPAPPTSTAGAGWLLIRETNAE